MAEYSTLTTTVAKLPHGKRGVEKKRYVQVIRQAERQTTTNTPHRQVIPDSARFTLLWARLWPPFARSRVRGYGELVNMHLVLHAE